MKCNEHVPPKERDYYVPCIMHPAGVPWGFTSVPDADCAAFYALTEKDPAGWHWQQSVSGSREGWRAPAVEGQPG